MAFLKCKYSSSPSLEDRGLKKTAHRTTIHCHCQRLLETEVDLLFPIAEIILIVENLENKQ